MTDRELLEAAAKKVGVNLALTIRPDGLPFWCEERGLALAWAPGWWNPLADDGDSARLRRALRIVVQWFPNDVAAMHWSDEGRGRSWAEMYGDDPAAAERRAVVRAAAAMAQP